MDYLKEGFGNVKVNEEICDMKMENTIGLQHATTHYSQPKVKEEICDVKMENTMQLTTAHQLQYNNLYCDSFNSMSFMCNVANTASYNNEHIANMPFPFDNITSVGPVPVAVPSTEPPTKVDDRGITLNCVEYTDNKVEYDYEACFTECVNVMSPDTKLADGFSLSSELTAMQNTGINSQQNGYRPSTENDSKPQTFQNNTPHQTTQKPAPASVNSTKYSPAVSLTTVTATGNNATNGQAENGLLTPKQEPVEVTPQKKSVDSAERKHKCDTCGKSFRLSNHLKTHQMIHSGIKSHVCECGKRFGRADHLKNHKLTHTKERPHQCAICGVRFRRPCALQIHKLTHSDERPYQCSTCGKRFKRPSHRDRHQRTHTKGQIEKPTAQLLDKIETVQSKPFPLPESLPMGLKEETGENTTVQQKPFPDSLPMGLKAETGENTTVQPKPFPESFPMSSKEKTGENTTMQPKPFPEISPIGFTQDANENTTVQLQSFPGSLPMGFTQDTSENSTLDLSSLWGFATSYNGHSDNAEKYDGQFANAVTTPKKSKPQCPVCGKEYLYPSKLKVHLASHTREKPYKCTLCTKAFKGSYSLSVHKKKVHGEKIANGVRQMQWASG